jgi:toxin ParE1/3/4
MHTVHLSLHAEEDLIEIFAWSLDRFGESAFRRYLHLLTVALNDLGENPERTGSIARPEYGANQRTYHLRFSRNKARTSEGIVLRPRHLAVYKVLNEHEVEVMRFLHDSMELERHLPRIPNDLD